MSDDVERIARGIASIFWGNAELTREQKSAAMSCAQAAVDRMNDLHPVKRSGLTQAEIISLIEEHQEVWGDSFDAWEKRAKKNPKEELKLQLTMVRHHEDMLGQAKHRIEVLEGRFGVGIKREETADQPEARVDPVRSSGEARDQSWTERQVGDPRK